jgi:hypothetical protein
MDLKVKKVLILCSADPTRGEIVSTVRRSGYRTLRVALAVEALESLQSSGVADLVILGQHENAGVLKEWLENNCLGVPIIVIVGCGCESEKIAHTDSEIKASELDQLPALIKQLIGQPKPLS